MPCSRSAFWYALAAGFSLGSKANSMSAGPSGDATVIQRYLPTGKSVFFTKPRAMAAACFSHLVGRTLALIAAPIPHKGDKCRRVDDLGIRVILVCRFKQKIDRLLGRKIRINLPAKGEYACGIRN